MCVDWTAWSIQCRSEHAHSLTRRSLVFLAQRLEAFDSNPPLALEPDGVDVSRTQGCGVLVMLQLLVYGDLWLVRFNPRLCRCPRLDLRR